MLDFLKRNARWIGGGFVLTLFSSFGQTFFISASANEWQASLGLSTGGFGQLYMVATLASAVSLPFVGRLVDIWPIPRVIALTIPTLALATLLAAGAPSVAALAIALYLLRLFGQGMMTHIALTTIGRFYAAQRGRAISLVVLGHQTGEALLPLTFTAFALSFGWQSGWIAGAVSLMLFALPVGVWAFSTKRQPKGQADVMQGGPSWTRQEVMADPLFWALLIGVLAPPLVGTTLFFHQDTLTTLREWPPALFASSFTVMALTTVVFALISGALIDRFGACRILPYFLAPLGCSCVIAGVMSAPWSLYLFMMLLGVSYGFSSTLFGSLWPEIYGTAHLGAIRSALVPFMVVATAIGPGLTGTLIDFGIGLPAQLIALGGYCGIGLITLTFASRALTQRAARLAAAGAAHPAPPPIG
ncbi:Major facilitator superfamily (MFS) transporter [Parvularcula bermudensis HTCC2503]|uniref:Major facilitator superfamily (MFS) transporter n=1 Tax=Parvularcula bermudensis (strain ATCC BAA-594 / HTCC2503 / KCTC 12087) TaxID=314260 RepID=E0TFY4_PARBH|nr:MFS transporter [Parvularcula bermudensis]ADM10103.1 Major facilitator superfamily (MFS) transporter [Parvularcula bermudensis HTCC2503]